MNTSGSTMTNLIIPTQIVKNLQVHKIKILNIAYGCDLCKTQIQYEATLTSHKLAEHERMKKYSCFKCDFRSNYEPHMKRHSL